MLSGRLETAVLVGFKVTFDHWDGNTRGVDQASLEIDHQLSIGRRVKATVDIEAAADEEGPDDWHVRGRFAERPFDGSMI